MVNLNKKETINLLKSMKKNEEEADKITAPKLEAKTVEMPIIKKPKKKSSFGKQVEIVLTLTFIVLLIPICSTFFIAFHNTDLAYNMIRMTDAVNNADLYDSNGTKVLLDFSKIVDTGSDFATRPLTTYYIESRNNLSLYFMLGLLDCLALGVFLGRVLK